MTQRQVKISIHTKECGLTLNTWLASRYTYHTLEQWNEHIHHQRILINEAACQPDYLLCAGDEVTYLPLSLEEPPVSLNIEILYDDEAILAVNKPADLPCHPAGRYFKHTLLYQLQQTHQDLRLINRLDRETSGVILLAKTKKAAAKLGRQFERRRVTKEYQVLVHGQFPEQLDATGILAVDPVSPVIKKRVFQWQGEGETCSTHFKRMGCTQDYSLLHVLLGTGRMHQIRATLCSLGYPVVGDKIYGLDETIFVRMVESGITDQDQDTLQLPHQALHAWRLTCRHPITQEEIVFEAALPNELQTFCSTHGLTS